MSALVKYKSVLIKLEEEIRSGKYAKSTLPSEAQLVKRFCVGRKTVQRAILELQHRGLVVRHQGRGTFLTKQGKKSTGLLGLLVPESSYSTMFHTLVRELARVGQSAGYTFLFGCASEGDAQAIIEQTYKFAKEFVEHRVEGVIFRPLVDERSIDVNLNVIKIIRDAGIPIVLIDSDVVASPLRSDFDIVGINNIVAGQRIARHLLEQGRKQIAFIMDASPLGLSINLRTRLFGLTGEIIAAGAKWDKQHLFITGADEVNKIKRILGRSFRPDAIVCANDEVAIRLMHTLQLIGIDRKSVV